MDLPRRSDRPAVAEWFAAALRERIMPYWCRTADPVHGGYRLDDPARDAAPRKHLVTQSRTLYGLSHAHRLGLGSGCLEAAAAGYRFLSGAMLDREHGGLVAVCAEDGTVVDDRKLLCQQSFAVYGLVEYHRASGDPAPLALALDLYRALQAHLHDDMHGGWTEHADRAWRPIRFTLPRAAGIVGVPELKSANTQMHWMEALSELFQATGDPAVGASLEESLHFNRACFYPPGESFGQQYRTRDWRPLGGSRYGDVSYGHDVEFAWLMWRAQEVLGREYDLERFDALVDHALHWGFDCERGGVYHGGVGRRPATDRRKVWWVQAEMLAALCDRLRLFGPGRPEHESGLDLLIEWIVRYQMLPDDGIWIAVLDELGRPLSVEKAGPWKACYHDVRAMAKCIAALR